MDAVNDLLSAKKHLKQSLKVTNLLPMFSQGSWLSFVLWLMILILMLKERHHLKAHLTDESMFGSEWGGDRRSVASRMSNQSFDKMSQSRYSNHSGSGSHMSSSQQGRRPRAGQQQRYINS